MECWYILQCGWTLKHTWWKKPVAKGHRLYGSICVKSPPETKSIETGSRSVVAGSGDEGSDCWWAGVSFWDIGNVLKLIVMIDVQLWNLLKTTELYIWKGYRWVINIKAGQYPVLLEDIGSLHFVNIGLARKFVWFFCDVWKNQNKFYGQPNNTMSECMGTKPQVVFFYVLFSFSFFVCFFKYIILYLP